MKQTDQEKIDGFVAKYGAGRGALIQVLQDMMGEFKYLPREALEYLSGKLNVPMSTTFHVATFYNAFSLTPKGKHIVNVCMGTACHVRGAKSILDKFERELGIKAGSTTLDGEYSLDTVACLGACALGPIVTLDEETTGHMNLSKVDKMLKKSKSTEAE